MREEVATLAIAVLVLAHGAPLVLKCDNGSGLTAAGIRAFVSTCGITLLLSPPGTPQYNGAAESQIRHLKERTEHQAFLAGRPGQWRAEDTERAQKISQDLYGLGPAGAAPPDRSAFLETLRRHDMAERTERGTPPDERLASRLEDEIRRVTVRRALVAHGIVSFRSSRVTPPIPRCRRDRIS